MNEKPQGTVKLKNGTEEFRPLVAVTRMHINKLLESNPIALYELVELCRDRHHKPFGQTGDDLVALSLATKTSDGLMVHESIRNIVLSATSGEGMEMTIGNPAQPPTGKDATP